ncbi:hypothetical protein [Deminuibacter soli]|uniref:Uncharacterized protein n=1 Tax=Deminuibacter soli TaxID=2291815 RepID=A0A3E1NHZ5_9BACT|nr:hypothetical protein [Deminuibacter soli]RFM27481.1 hypothetical protein DXN05_15825 [Deminuibacter soli]
MLQNVAENIIDWSTKTGSSQAYYADIAGKLRVFSGIANVRHYINDDAENYCDITAYESLLKEMAGIAAPDVVISNVSSANDGENWQFYFSVNGNELHCSIPDPETDWLQPGFLENVNALLAPYTNKQFSIVMATSMSNSDQCFDMVFITADVLQDLINHPDQYALAQP